MFILTIKYMSINKHNEMMPPPKKKSFATGNKATEIDPCINIGGLEH